MLHRHRTIFPKILGLLLDKEILPSDVLILLSNCVRNSLILRLLNDTLIVLFSSM